MCGHKRSRKRKVLLRKDSFDDLLVELLVIEIADAVVELGAGHHLGEMVGDDASRSEGVVEALYRARGDAQGRNGINDELVAELLPLIAGDLGRAAELGHVGKQRRLDRIAHTANIVEVGQSLDKNNVGSSLDIN